MSVKLYDPPVRMENWVVPAAKAVLIPETEDSIPFNAAKKQGEPLDLGSLGFLEEEYLISGESHVYQLGPTRADNTYVKAFGAPYTDRILVRKPQDPKAFSGHVVIEIMNSAFGMDNPEAGWGALHPYILSRGDAWVGMTINSLLFPALKKYDEKRYGALSAVNPIPEEKRGKVSRAYGLVTDPNVEKGLLYDALSETAQLIRSGSDDSPFKGYDVRFIYATGATPGDLTTYAGFVHNYAKQANGKPVFDGFQIYMTGAPANLNNEEWNVLVPDPRVIIDSCVPTFRVLTMGDMLGFGGHPDWSVMQRKDDTDDPVYRIYEVAGAPLGIRGDVDTMMNKADCDAIGARWFNKKARLPYHAYPTQYILRSCFDNLKKYCEFGILPPKADRLRVTGTYPEMDYEYDELGNVLGGIRSNYVDVPIAHYLPDGHIEPFNKEKLRELYGTHANYMKKVSASCLRQMKDRFMLPEDLAEQLELSMSFNIDDDELMDRLTKEGAEGTYGM